ncbi:MAG: membrane or secreted protein [Bacteroidetes bacterium]|nr:MAG: membrane or secreted protein [Bacteroidota bacterium]
MLKAVLITILLLSLAVGGIAIKMFVKKGGEFKKSCSTIDPNTGERVGCTCGGETDTCKNR